MQDLLDHTTDKFLDYFYNDDLAILSLPEPKTIPEDKNNNKLVICIYVCLLAVGGVGNLTVFISLFKSRRRKSRVNLMMTHLSFADMIVTFVHIPVEIGWRATNIWLAGNIACKVLSVLRAFGLYLSSNVLVCISLDRFFAVLYPLRVTLARRRSKMMLLVAWIVALLCSLPQSYIFRVEEHPRIKAFVQCIALGSLTEDQEKFYNFFCTAAMYFLPLAIITFCYVKIYLEIGKNCDAVKENLTNPDILRRSDQQLLERARSRTLKMTVTIVCVFAFCGLPYVTMTMWYMINRKSAANVSRLVQDLFFIMAVSNSCMDPWVYGTYALNFKRGFKDFFNKFSCGNVLLDDGSNIVASGSTLKNTAGIKVNHEDKMIPKSKRMICNNNHFDKSYNSHSVIQSEPPLHTSKDYEIQPPIKPAVSFDLPK